MEMVIDREHGDQQRLFECNELKVLSRFDILTMVELPFIGYEDDSEGLMWMKAFNWALEVAREPKR